MDTASIMTSLRLETEATTVIYTLVSKDMDDVTDNISDVSATSQGMSFGTHIVRPPVLLEIHPYLSTY